MIIFLFGDDLFSLNEKLKEIKLSYEKKSKLKLYFKFIDLNQNQEEGLRDFKDFLKLSPMFLEKKFVILKGLEGLNAKEKKELKKFLEDVNASRSGDEIIVLVNEGKIIKSQDFFKELLKNSKYQEFKKEDEETRVKRMIASFIKTHSIKIEGNILPLLINGFKGELGLLKKELEKISAYAKRELITSQMFGEIFAVKEDLNIFDFIESVFKRNKKEALKKVTLLLAREEELRIFGLLRISFERLLLVKYLRERGLSLTQIQKKLKKHLFYIQRLLEYSRNFNLEELLSIYKKFIDLEIKLKTGSYHNKKLLFQLFLMEVI